MPAHAQRMSSLLAADKEVAACRVGRRACDALWGDGSASGVREDGLMHGCRGQGDGNASGMHWEGSTQGWGAGAERTKNICCMVVTLDVSKLSGWLNADAACRVEGRACDASRGIAREA